MSKNKSEVPAFSGSGMAQEMVWELGRSGLDIQKLSHSGDEQRTNEDKVNHFAGGGSGTTWGKKGNADRRGGALAQRGVNRQHPQG